MPNTLVVVPRHLVEVNNNDRYTLHLDVKLEWQWRHILERSAGQNLADGVRETQCNRLTICKNAGVVIQLCQRH